MKVEYLTQGKTTGLGIENLQVKDLDTVPSGFSVLGP